MVNELQVEPEQEALRARMEESREALAHKIEQLEEKVTETVENATSTVAEATATVMETVQTATATVSETVDTVTNAVQGTVETVRHSVEGTVDSVKEAFDLRRQVEQHPWFMFTGAVGVGFMAAKLIPNLSETMPARSSSRGYDWSSRSTPGFEGQSFAAHRETQSNGAPSNGSPMNAPSSNAATSWMNTSSWMNSLRELLGPEIVKVRNLTIGAAMNSLKETVVKAVPQPVQQPLAKIFDEFTEKLGAHPLQS